MKNLVYISVISLLLLTSCASNKMVEDSKVSDGEKIYEFVDEMPQLPGGVNNFICRNLRYPVIAQENGITGMVFVRFVVEKDGSVTNAKITKPVDPALDNESIRVVRAMPKWIPGKKNGKKVRVYYTVPINYRLD